MIQANELRIGNLVKTDANDFEAITIEDLQFILDDDLDDFYQPISLTEEWLFKLGFEKSYLSKETDWYLLNRFEVSTYSEGEIVYFVYEHLVLRHVTKVHQLQNLYFALTNKELEIQK